MLGRGETHFVERNTLRVPIPHRLQHGAKSIALQGLCRCSAFFAAPLHFLPPDYIPILYPTHSYAYQRYVSRRLNEMVKP